MPGWFRRNRDEDAIEENAAGTPDTGAQDGGTPGGGAQDGGTPGGGAPHAGIPDAGAADADDADADGAFDKIPDFALVVAETGHDGWHLAAMLAEGSSPAFYVRALTVRWPFVIARPVPSNRRSDRIIDPRRLSPSGSTPTRKLVVNWGWEDAGQAVLQLRFFAKHAGWRMLQRTGPLIVRTTLKQSAWPRQRIVVPVRSNPVPWRYLAADDDDEDDEVLPPEA